MEKHLKGFFFFFLIERIKNIKFCLLHFIKLYSKKKLKLK